MSVRIRLSRIGRKKKPFYRLIVVDGRKKRDGAYIANIGTYDALKTKLVMFNEDLYKGWVSKGAQPTDTAKKLYALYKKSGVSGAKADVAAASD